MIPETRKQRELVDIPRPVVASRWSSPDIEGAPWPSSQASVLTHTPPTPGRNINLAQSIHHVEMRTPPRRPSASVVTPGTCTRRYPTVSPQSAVSFVTLSDSDASTSSDSSSSTSSDSALSATARNAAVAAPAARTSVTAFAPPGWAAATHDTTPVASGQQTTGPESIAGEVEVARLPEQLREKIRQIAAAPSKGSRSRALVSHEGQRYRVTMLPDGTLRVILLAPKPSGGERVM